MNNDSIRSVTFGNRTNKIEEDGAIATGSKFMDGKGRGESKDVGIG